MWLPATSPIAVLWRERDADAGVLGNADVAHYRAKAGPTRSVSSIRTSKGPRLRATGSKENCPWGYQGKAPDENLPVPS
jgi:hypothetical protein